MVKLEGQWGTSHVSIPTNANATLLSTVTTVMMYLLLLRFERVLSTVTIGVARLFSARVLCSTDCCKS